VGCPVSKAVIPTIAAKAAPKIANIEKVRCIVYFSSLMLRAPARILLPVCIEIE